MQPNDAFGTRLVGLSPRFWALLLITAVGAGLGAGLLMALLRAVQHLAYSYSAGHFLDAVQAQPVQRRLLVVFAAGAVTAAGLLVLARVPGGSGGRLNERIWFHSGRMSELKTIAQAVLSIVVVGLGASLGRETAPKQTGAAVASWASRWGGLSTAESRLLAACGAGAGIGAVYNVPLGGALFALEVLLGTLALPLIPPALAASVVATVTAWSMLPNQPTYAVPGFPVLATQLAWSVLFGPVAGAASVLYVRLIVLADGMSGGRSAARLLLPLASFAVLALLAVPFPQLLGNGKDVVELAFAGRLTVTLLLALALLKPLATAICLASGAPGGLFTPSLTFGALLGALLGQVWTLLWPGAAPGSYAVIGAASVLAASMQAPLAAVVLLIELAPGAVSLLVPILLAVAGAAATARLLDPRSVYSGRVHTGKRAAAAKSAPAAPALADLLQPEVRPISVAATFPEVLQRLTARDREAPVYVIDEQGRYAGRIEAADAAAAPALTQVLSAAAAGDLLRRGPPLDARASRAEALARLAAEPSHALPVVDSASGRLVGSAVLPAGAARPDRIS